MRRDAVLLLVALALSACDSAPARRAPVVVEELAIAKAPDASTQAATQAPLDAQVKTVPVKLPTDLWLGPAPSRSFVEAADRDVVVLQLGERAVTLAEVDSQLRTLPFTAAAGLHHEQGRKRFLEQARDFELFAAEARRRGLESRPEVRFARLIGLGRALRQKVYDETLAAVTEAEIAERYTQLQNRYQSPERRRGNLLLVATQDEAKTLCAELVERAPSASPQRVRIFEEIAQRATLHASSKPTGGRLRAVTADDASTDPVQQAYVQAIFELAPYELSEPFPVGTQWGVALLVAVNPARSTSLAEASDGLRTLIGGERAAARFEERIAETVKSIAPTADLAPLAKLDEHVVTNELRILGSPFRADH